MTSTLPATTPTPPASISDLFGALWRDGEHVSICHDDTGAFRSTVVPVGIDAYLAAGEHAAGGNVWHGVNPVREGVAGRGTAQDVTRLAALWADLDVKPGAMPDDAAALTVVDELAGMLHCPPSFVVHTGHGLHPYWILDDDEQLVLDDDAKRARARALLARWRRLVTRVAAGHGGTVDAVFDLPRVLRTPGTHNRKDATPVAVTIEAGGGWALDVAAVTSALDEWDVPELDTDTTGPGAVLAPRAVWEAGSATCGYVTRMIDAWAGDTPPGRHHWAYSQHVRLACALRLGCLTPPDYTRALGALQARLDVLRAHDGPRPGEVTANERDAVAVAETKTDEQARAELGNHHHPGDRADGDDLAGIIISRSTTPTATTSLEASSTVDVDPEPSSTWAPTDLGPILDGLQAGTLTRPAPTVGVLTGGLALFYPGRVNGLAGESGSGKTWTALACVAQELAAGHSVVYIDLEDDAAGILSRLIDLAVDPVAIRARFAYVHPDERLDEEGARALADTLTSFAPSLVVIDSTGEALALDGAKPNADEEVAAWFRRLPRPIADRGPAVLILDHVIKADDGGLWPIGSQRKRAAITGAQYMQKAARPFDKNTPGHAMLTCAKDRSGNYRAGQHVADLRVTPRENGVLVELVASVPRDMSKPFRPTVLMEKISRALEAETGPMSGQAIEANVPGRAAAKRQALEVLVTEGFVSRISGPRNAKLHAVLAAYRQTDDAQADGYSGRDEVKPQNASESTVTPSVPIGGDDGRGALTPSGTRSGRGGTTSGQLISCTVCYGPMTDPGDGSTTHPTCPPVATR